MEFCYSFFVHAEALVKFGISKVKTIGKYSLQRQDERVILAKSCGKAFLEQFKFPNIN